MAGSILTPQLITQQALEILESEMDKEYVRGNGLPRVFSLFEVALKDGTVLGPIMLELTPYEIERVQTVVKEGYKMVTLANENESILFPAADIKYIKALRVTSKE